MVSEYGSNSFPKLGFEEFSVAIRCGAILLNGYPVSSNNQPLAFRHHEQDSIMAAEEIEEE